MSLSDIDLLLWGLPRSRKNRGIRLPKYMIPTLVHLPLITLSLYCKLRYYRIIRGSMSVSVR